MVARRAPTAPEPCRIFSFGLVRAARTVARVRIAAPRRIPFRRSHRRPACRPRVARDRERRLRQARTAKLAKLLAPRIVETGNVGARRADAELVRRPPIVEAGELDAGG